MNLVLSSFWPLFALAKPDDENNNVSCTIAEKYNIVYSYNTVLGEEPDLKIVNLVCVALKKKDRDVVYESVVNYLKNLLEDNSQLRAKVALNAYRAVFNKAPLDEELELLNQIAFEGIYSFEELKILLDLNKDRFTEIAHRADSKKYDLAKEGGDIETQEADVQRTFKALTIDDTGELVNSGYCPLIGNISPTETHISLNNLTRDESLVFLDTEVDVETGYGAVTQDSTDIGTVDPNTIVGVARFRGSNEFTYFSLGGGNITAQNVSNGTTINSNNFINSTTFAKQAVQSSQNLTVFSANESTSESTDFGSVTQTDGSTTTSQEITVAPEAALDLNNPNNIISLAALPDTTDKLLALTIATDLSGDSIETLNVVTNTSGSYTVDLSDGGSNSNIFNISTTVNGQPIVHNFIDIPAKTIRTGGTEQFQDIKIGTLGFIHDRTQNLDAIGQLTSTTDEDAFRGFSIFDFHNTSNLFLMAYHFFGTDSSPVISPEFIKGSLADLNPEGGTGPFVGDEFISGIKTTVDPANPDDHYILVSYYRKTTSSGTLQFTNPISSSEISSTSGATSTSSSSGLITDGTSSGLLICNIHQTYCSTGEFFCCAGGTLTCNIGDPICTSVEEGEFVECDDGSGSFSEDNFTCDTDTESFGTTSTEGEGSKCDVDTLISKCTQCGCDSYWISDTDCGCDPPECHASCFGEDTEGLEFSPSGVATPPDSETVEGEEVKTSGEESFDSGYEFEAEPSSPGVKAIPSPDATSPDAMPPSGSPGVSPTGPSPLSPVPGPGAMPPSAMPGMPPSAM
ncbi:MAG: hypothetical protein HYR97_04475, partial [Candidatus Melainabacteria bacterium]|nr:hypothetical protein [Candidatus Melainabacteria bacterium]